MCREACLFVGDHPLNDDQGRAPGAGHASHMEDYGTFAGQRTPGRAGDSAGFPGARAAGGFAADSVVMQTVTAFIWILSQLNRHENFSISMPFSQNKRFLVNTHIFLANSV